MPLGQRLGKPSRSYLQGLNEAGDGAETGSILSFRSGGSSFSQQQGRRAAGQHNGGGSQAGSVRGRFDSLPPSVMNGSAVPRARGSAASDIGMTFTPASPSRRDTIASSKARNSGNRRSVQFSDMAPAVFDEREKLEVMSDVGGYRGMGFGFRKRTPSVISSVMDDNASDAGSTMSHRRSVKRPLLPNVVAADLRNNPRLAIPRASGCSFVCAAEIRVRDRSSTHRRKVILTSRTTTS